MKVIRTVLSSWFTYALLWALTRAYLGWELINRVGYIVGDVNYYFVQLDRARGDMRQALVEYPTPVAWALEGLRLATGREQSTFVAGFVMLMLLLDALMVWLLWSGGGRRRPVAVVVWILFVLFMGPLAYVRFDLAPALLAAAAILWCRRRPATAGSLVAFGAGLKLWPALLVLPLLGRSRLRIRAAIGFVATGITLALASVVLTSWARTISPLTWQTDRGLQVESIPATWLMWLRTFDPGIPFQVALSKYNAYEISGPGTALSLQAATVSTVLGMVAIAWLGWRVVRLEHRRESTVAVVMLAIILVMIVTNKTLSPQYLFWLGGPVCALVAATDAEGEELSGAPLLYAGAAWLLALLTQQVYPVLYGELVGGRGTPLSTSVLVLRNVMLLVLTVITIWYAALRTRQEQAAFDGSIAVE